MYSGASRDHRALTSPRGTSARTAESPATGSPPLAMAIGIIFVAFEVARTAVLFDATKINLEQIGKA